MKRSRRAASGRALPLRRRVLSLEALEDRHLLSIQLLGIPDYQQQGSGPIIGAQADAFPHDEVSGAINAILPLDGNHVLVGTVNGGIWRTSNAQAVDESTFTQPRHVEWESLTDQFGSLSIDSLATAGGGVIYAGIGDRSSFDDFGGATTGILRSTDGGNTWQQLGGRPPSSPPTVQLGGSQGGNLRPGTYYLKYTFVNAGGQSMGSLESAQFTVTGPAVPAVNSSSIQQVILPPLPPGATSYNVYLTPPNGAPGTENILYGLGVVPNTYVFLNGFPNQPPSSDTTSPPLGTPAALAFPCQFQPGGGRCECGGPAIGHLPPSVHLDRCKP